ncbi:hypothetical protein ACQKKX_05115 [Neorhizobium sp. NPDC001467]|uniref:hypothetical protein n=1 Tax=Neorhizobium sp. NPDC001467 TaxID=3390595 RepID=UPI003CFF8FD9
MSASSTRPILLLEDQPLIALKLEDLLVAAGMGEVVCLRSVEEGLAWLEARSPSVVVLDYHLKDGASVPILELATRRDIPCVVHSALPKPEDLDPLLVETIPWLDKPSDPRVFIDTVLAMATGRSAT